MRVDGDGGREVGARELAGVRAGKDGGAAPRGVNVQPDAVLLADGREGPDGVVRAEDGGAGRGVEEERGAAFFFGRGDAGGEGGRVHGAGFWVDGDGADGGGAETECLGGFFDAIVSFMIFGVSIALF